MPAGSDLPHRQRNCALAQHGRHVREGRLCLPATGMGRRGALAGRCLRQVEEGGAAIKTLVEAHERASETTSTSVGRTNLLGRITRSVRVFAADERAAEQIQVIKAEHRAGKSPEIGH